jgi:hypothetical protein
MQDSFLLMGGICGGEILVSGLRGAILVCRPAAPVAASTLMVQANPSKHSPAALRTAGAPTYPRPALPPPRQLSRLLLAGCAGEWLGLVQEPDEHHGGRGSQRAALPAITAAVLRPEGKGPVSVLGRGLCCALAATLASLACCFGPNPLKEVRGAQVRPHACCRAACFWGNKKAAAIPCPATKCWPLCPSIPIRFL